MIHAEVDEKSSTISVDAWLRLAWTDEHLQWNPDEYGGLKQVHFGAWEIWRPDIQLYNSAVLPNANNGSYGHATHFVVGSEGNVLWVPPAKLVAYCKVSYCTTCVM